MEKNIKNQNEQQSDRISTENIVNKPIAIDELNMSSKVTPGDIVPGGFTYPNNAIVQNDFLYLRDANGNQIAGRTVSIGDKITVLKIHHDKQLALVQYPAGSVVREGYVTNSTKVIKYLNEYNWVNDSSAEPVYETESSSDGKWGTLSAYEKATKLYKSNNRICVAYDTSKGAHTKSGFVEYEGGSNNSGSNNTNNINPGDIVPGGFTYPNNAVIENDFLYLRDANGNQIAGRTVSVGDKITVLDVGYAKQLALIQYPTSSGVRQGYVTNATNIIRYLDEYNYYNGSTSETVYANSTGSATLGSLNPYECATKLYSKDGRIHVVYDTDKGGHTKSGYVNFAGLDVPVTNITIPDISDSDVTKIEYGKSGKGRPLNVYKIGNGKKALFAGFALHGFEDHWFRDGEALVKIATDLIYKLANYKRTNGDLHGYTVYVAQCMNPDGVIEGRSQNGPGRCAVVSRVDMNRCFPYKFSVNTNSRYYTGSSPLGAIEAVKLRDLILKIRSESTETYVLDFHGWLGFTQGNYDAAKYIANQFGYTHNYTDAGGFFSSWANSLGTDIKGALIEYPKSTANYQSVLNGNYAGKTFNGIINLIKNNAGTGNSNTGNGDQAYNATGKVINVTSTLNVRNQPSTSGTVVGTLKGDQTVTITAKNGSWYKISSPLVGYVHSDYISITSDTSGDEVYNATGKVITVTSTLNVRNQPSTSGTVVGTLKGDQSVTITAKNGSWYKISSPLVGYVHSDYISITNTSNGDQAFNTTGKVINVTSTLNVRNQPSTSGTVVGTLKGGQSVIITARNRWWYKISFPLVGYIHSDYVQVDSNTEYRLKEKAEKRSFEFLSNFLGFNGKIEIEIPVIIDTTGTVVTFKPGLEPFINDNATLKFDILNGEIDDSTFLGNAIKSGFNFIGTISHPIKEKFLKFSEEVGNSAVEIEIKSDFSIDINFSLTLEDEELGAGARVYCNMNIKPRLKENISNKIKELISLLKGKINNLLLSLIIGLLLIGIILSPIDDILVILTTISTFIASASQSLIDSIIENIFNVVNNIPTVPVLS